jgi:hypothetical protein
VNRDRHHQLYRAIKQLFKILLEPEVRSERVLSPGEKFNEEVDTAQLLVESLRARRTEDLESADAVGAANPRDPVAVEREPDSHDESLPRGRFTYLASIETDTHSPA